MPTFSGSGYLFNVLRRGAAPLASVSKQIPPRSIPSEAPLVEINNELLEMQNEFARAPESTRVEIPRAHAEVYSHAGVETPTTKSLPESMAGAADLASEPEVTMDREPNVVFDEQREFLLAKAAEPTAAAATGPAQPPPLLNSMETLPLPQARQSPPSNQAFVLKMPDHFFGPPPDSSTAADSETKPTAQPLAPAAPIEEQVEDLPKPRLISLAKPLPPAETQFAKPVDREESVSGQRFERTGEAILLAQEHGAALAVLPAVPREERPAREPQRLGPPPNSEAQMSPPSRLRINRMDITIVNTAPPAPVRPQRAPDVSQLLEREHLGRIDLLL